MNLRFGRKASVSSTKQVAAEPNTQNSIMSVDNTSGMIAGKTYSNNDIMAAILKNQGVLATITNDVAKIQEDIGTLKTKNLELSNQVNDVDGRLDNLQSEVTGEDGIKEKLNLTMAALRKSQISAVKSDYNNMQYNIIVRNMREVITGGESQETQSNSIECAYIVLETVFRISNARNTIVLSTAHRLPSIKGRRPLIFKLARLSDKKTLWDNITNVKTFNHTKADSEKIYVQMIQLPAKLANDRNSLQDDYDKARNNGDGPKWRYLKKSGQYCYTIGNTYFKPKVDYFLHEYVRKTK